MRGVGASGGDAGEEPVEIGLRVEAAPQAAAGEAVKDRPARAGFDVADEQPVFPAKGAGADGVLHAVVVYLHFAVIEIGEQARPLPGGVGTGFADRALRPLGEEGAVDAAAQCGHDAARAGLAQQGAGLRLEAQFTGPAFDAV